MGTDASAIMASAYPIPPFFTKITFVAVNTCEHLKGLTQPKTLDLRATKVTEEGVKRLQQALPNCRIRH